MLIPPSVCGEQNTLTGWKPKLNLLGIGNEDNLGHLTLAGSRSLTMSAASDCCLQDLVKDEVVRIFFSLLYSDWKREICEICFGASDLGYFLWVLMGLISSCLSLVSLLLSYYMSKEVGLMISERVQLPRCNFLCNPAGQAFKGVLCPSCAFRVCLLFPPDVGGSCMYLWPSA